MKNKFVKIGIVAGLVLLGLLAYKKINAGELHGNFSIGYDSEVDFRGWSHETDAINSSFSGSLEVLGVDLSVGALADIKDGADESRFYAETGIELLEGTSTSLGVVTYDNNPILGDDTEIYVDLGLDSVFSPNVRVYFNPEENITTVEGGLSHSLELFSDYSLGLGASIGSTELAGDRVTYYDVEAKISRPLNDDIDVFVVVDFVDVENSQNRDSSIGVFAGITHSF